MNRGYGPLPGGRLLALEPMRLPAASRALTAASILAASTMRMDGLAWGAAVLKPFHGFELFVALVTVSAPNCWIRLVAASQLVDLALPHVV